MSSIAISENPDRLLRPKATLMEIISFILTVSALFFFLNELNTKVLSEARI